MAQVSITTVPGGSGIKSHSVSEFCGLHKNWISNGTVIDLSGTAATVNLFVAPGPCTIQSITVTYIEAVSADGDGTVVCGKIDGGSTDADYFGTATPTASAAAGSQQSLTVLNSGTVATGDVVTVGHTQKTGAGTAFFTVEYTIDDENYGDQ